MEINVTKEYDNTIKSGIIDEDIKSKVTDFNLENDQIDHLNLDIDIIKDPAKWPVINDKIKLLLVKNNPIQINLNYYPLDDSKSKFSNIHYFKTLPNGEKLKRTCLIYSESSDSVYCSCCKLFKKDTSSLSKQGTRDWKNISQILKQHDNSLNHKIAYKDWKTLHTRMKQGKTIDDENQVLIRKETKYWKDIIERIISVIQTLGTQNLALRGSSDKLYEFDNGNFLKFIELLGKFDCVTKEHITRITYQDMDTHYPLSR
ncbi:zinc finger MYM-type protein 1-like [Aphis craccivora]|uniref:Zinc finger MYM-type protein 1-like n=1 Tax=Aphis craccivora TaxID=307492 RepID=A0A6G0Y002_APHCR|nr:zinc finger MYM-type protein 1-like [Aphis craccivora]